MYAAPVLTLCIYSAYLELMRFEWDPAKNRSNIRNHGIDFADAQVVFDGPTWERWDDRKDYGEERWVAIKII